MEATDQVTGQLDSMMEAGRSLANSADAAADSAEDALDNTSDLVMVNLDDLRQTMSSFRQTADEVLRGVQSTGEVEQKQVEALQAAADALRSRFRSAMETITIPDTDAAEEVDAAAKAVGEDFDKINDDLLVLADASEQTIDEASALAQEIQKDLDTCAKSLDGLYETYQNVVDPQLSSTMNGIQNSILEVQRILNYSSNNIDDVSSALDSYPDMMSFGKEQLVKSREEAQDMEDKLLRLIADIEDMEGNDQYSTLMALISSDPEVIADFISSPVNLEQEPIYGVENNGSATAPFYIVLSIWFGALILIAIIHTDLKTNPGCRHLMNYQKFFGRYLIFYLIGQVQTVITVFGSLWYVGIQCEHPFLFWLAASITSFTFTLFMYSLSYAFGNVGEALAVVLMVIQVAGSGGTFPVEVLPQVFRILYKYMPFAYGMNAMRETIAGMHGSDYWNYLAGMLIYIALALLFGLGISIPYAKLNEMIEESKEKTDLLV
jgi:putative membrane protein